MTNKSKKAAKKVAPAAPQTQPAVAQEPQGRPEPKPIIRAIRVTAELLAAAKVYKKATGTSFYALGCEAISERLKREGYLKGAESGAAS